MRLTNRKTSRRRKGFTLVEVLLVLVILVIIASLAVTAYAPMQRRAYIDMARTQIGAFEGPLDAFRLHMNDFPMTGDGLEALRQPPADAQNWSGPYLGKPIPADPWGRPYQYAYPGQFNNDKPDIWSMGPDGADGTDDDVTNW